MISNLSVGIHPRFPSSRRISLHSPTRSIRYTFVPSCKTKRSVPLSDGELFTVMVGAKIRRIAMNNPCLLLRSKMIGTYRNKHSQQTGKESDFTQNDLLDKKVQDDTYEK